MLRGVTTPGGIPKTVAGRGRSDDPRRVWMPRCWLALACALLVLGACQRAPGPVATVAPQAEESGPLRGFHYVVRLDQALSTAAVEVCFEGRPPDRFMPGMPEHARWATAVRTSDGERLRKTRKGVDLRELPAGSCIELDIDLEALAPPDSGSRIAQRRGQSVIARASAWLWRPSEVPRGADVTLRFELPEGYEASVPWPTVGDAPRGPDATYSLDITAFRWLAYAVWGRVSVLHVQHVGVDLDVVTLDDELACTDAGLQAWLRDATETVAPLFGGTFPRRRLQVVVVPVEGRGGGVYFGMAARGGGSGIFILMDSEAHARELPGGWTTVHEMLHHGMPFIVEPWMAEGFVTYYTELMRTRSGHREEAEGWARLADGFARGERGGRGITLQATSDRMHEVFAYQRVYWGGAAIAFMLDVALREDSQGAVSLDDAMVELRRCCGDATKRWKAADLLGHLDQWYGKPLFTDVAERHLTSITFPPVDEGFESLGVEIGYSGEARLDETHPAAATRRSIMAPPAESSRAPESDVR